MPARLRGDSLQGHCFSLQISGLRLQELWDLFPLQPWITFAPSHVGSESPWAIQVRWNTQHSENVNWIIHFWWFCSVSNNAVPTYVSSEVEDNRRTYTSTSQVYHKYKLWSKLQYHECSNGVIFQTGIFTATNDVTETYDAYERDIAIVSFYFKLPTAFEYTRYRLLVRPNKAMCE